MLLMGWRELEDTVHKRTGVHKSSMNLSAYFLRLKYIAQQNHHNNFNNIEKTHKASAGWFSSMKESQF